MISCTRNYVLCWCTTYFELQTTKATSCPLVLNTPPPLAPACTAHVVYKWIIKYIKAWNKEYQLFYKLNKMLSFSQHWTVEKGAVIQLLMPRNNNVHLCDVSNLFLVYQTGISVSLAHSGNFIWHGGYQISCMLYNGMLRLT
jgi:hypothetical protein